MKIFNKNRKINFVDDNNVFVGFDNESDYNESFGHFFTYSLDPIEEVNLTEDKLEGFNFDKTFFVDTIVDPNDEEEQAVAFCLEKGNDKIYLVLVNSHNGYYSHGFEMGKGNEIFHEGSL